ncbi:aminotransferase class I/II-fold pyridoxal phosphate-dependent enzyme [Flagellimonas pacifica]|uniref:7-keto-8-aminopelargonate synthetase n=1 Tax=Flagellimonas pacifica TaxID=1247520 RepID=A0A285MTF8_9FLAO|nr:aminotransferase class I/II-fold pyridoxal phosphate-dependent enzyme [Allomuricauda parva]SNZ00475.1 7-keto-8-aminopelargonate synthetase [Allomuricauda parva]
MAFSLDSFPERTIQMGGKEYLYFGGTAYLGLQMDKEFQDTFIKNLKKYGTNFGASRKSNVQLSIFEKVEKHLAAIIGSEDCITLSSGYLAGQFISQYLNSNTHQVFYAPKTHSALYSEPKKTYTTFAELGSKIRNQLNSGESKIPVVFMDTITFSGNGYPEFKELQSFPLHQIILVADDSHGIGIVGEHGTGAYNKLKSLNPKELIVCSSLGKGFGIQAGAIFGSYERITKLRETDFYRGASPAAPVGLATLMDSYAFYQRQRKALKTNINLFKRNVDRMQEFIHIPDHPTFGFSNASLAEYLIEKRVIITNFRYPNKTSSLKSRIVLSAAHKKEDILHLTKYLNAFS